MILPVLSWALLAVGCVMIAQSVYALVTGRFPPLYSKGDPASPLRPHAWTTLFLALAIVATALPRVLDWSDEWLIASIVLASLFLAGVFVMRARAKKAASPTESRDIDPVP
ncbi:hypothetical protein [Streptosporangium sp. NPDC002524]|uniref:hypothetical protein n=1 Tax=Streptosporangium sp. NPDC002524 TaxID=3154537 RepID=UPI00332CF743